MKAFILMGFLYAREISFGTYSLKDYGTNLMISGASLCHVKAKEESRVEIVVKAFNSGDTSYLARSISGLQIEEAIQNKNIE